MIPRSPTNRTTRLEPAPSPAPAAARVGARSADLAREMIGGLRSRLGTGALGDRRATGHLDAGALIGSVPAAVDLEAVRLPKGNTDALQLGPGRRTPTSKLRLG